MSRSQARLSQGGPLAERAARTRGRGTARTMLSIQTSGGSLCRYRVVLAYTPRASLSPDIDRPPSFRGAQRRAVSSRLTTTPRRRPPVRRRRYRSIDGRARRGLGFARCRRYTTVSCTSSTSVWSVCVALGHLTVVGDGYQISARYAQSPRLDKRQHLVVHLLRRSVRITRYTCPNPFCGYGSHRR